MAKENIIQEFRLKHLDETRNYLIEEISPNELMSKKHKKISTILNYFELFLILASAVTGYVSISGFAPLIGISIRTTSSVIGLRICAITARIKNYKSIIKKKKKNHDKLVSLAKSKLKRIEVLTFEPVIDSNISHVNLSQ